MHPIAVRLDDEQIQRLDRIALELAKRLPGVKVCRGDAVRATVERGVASFEAELKITADEA